MSEMLELAERAEAATGPDRELDAAIHAATLGSVTNAFGQTVYRGRGCGSFSPKRFSYSLDAAMTLLDARALWAVGDMEEGSFARLCWPQPDGGYTGGYHEAFAATPALALCAAALRARAASSGSPVSNNKEEGE